MRKERNSSERKGTTHILEEKIHNLCLKNNIQKRNNSETLPKGIKVKLATQQRRTASCVGRDGAKPTV